MIETTLTHVEAGGHLTMEQMAEALGLVMSGACRETEIARFLLALRNKGETVAEVAGAAAALRQHMTPIRSSRIGVVDTCGTGGDGSGTFNISTAAALVAAAAGVPVAKHGNRGITSRSGSADALAALGVNIQADVSRSSRPAWTSWVSVSALPPCCTGHAHVAPVRKKLGVPTIFNILGPLANPAGAPFQLLGVGRSQLQPLLAEALTLLGTQRALVVHGADGLDEVTLADATEVIEAGPQGTRHFRWSPEDFDLEVVADLGVLQVSGPQESAVIIRQVLEGQCGPARDIVVANAAAVLWLVRRDDQPRRCAQLASEAIDSGAARDLLARLVEKTSHSGRGTVD